MHGDRVSFALLDFFGEPFGKGAFPPFSYRKLTEVFRIEKHLRTVAEVSDSAFCVGGAFCVFLSILFCIFFDARNDAALCRPCGKRESNLFNNRVKSESRERDFPKEKPRKRRCKATPLPWFLRLLRETVNGSRARISWHTTHLRVAREPPAYVGVSPSAFSRAGEFVALCFASAHFSDGGKAGGRRRNRRRSGEVRGRRQCR